MALPEYLLTGGFYSVPYSAEVSQLNRRTAVSEARGPSPSPLGGPIEAASWRRMHFSSSDAARGGHSSAGVPEGHPGFAAVVTPTRRTAPTAARSAAPPTAGAPGFERR